MKIAYDFTSTVKPELTGIGRYAVEILRAMLRQLAPEDRVILGYRLSRWHRRKHAPKFTDPRVSVRPLQSPFAFLTYGAPDVFHGLGVNVPLGLPAKRKFVTVHGFVSLEEVAPEKREAYRRRLAKIRTMVERAHRGFVVSEFERQRTAEFVGCPVEKLVVVHHGVDHATYRAGVPAELDERLLGKAMPRRPYLLALGAITARKNLVRLMEAYGSSPVHKEFDLVLAGQERSESAPILAAVDAYGLRDCVHVTGFVSAEALPAWIRRARALVHPSLYEAFGLPLVEAMACGTPVICSNTSAMPEVTAGAARLFDPTDTAAIRYAIESICNDDAMHAELRARGLERAAELTWDRAAARTLAAYRAE